MIGRRAGIALALLALVAVVTPAHAGPVRLEPWRGHLSVGYSKLFSDSLAPGGSFSLAVGLDYPVGGQLRVGPTVGYHLLGSTTVDRGSLSATVDYSLLDAALLLSYLPSRGPVARISAGPAVGSAHAELSTAGGGLGFRDLAVGEVKGGLAFETTLLSRRQTVVAPGFEAGLRWFPVSGHDWIVMTARATVHY